MTHLSGAQLTAIAHAAARRAPHWMRDDVRGDAALALVQANPLTVDDANAIAERAANASRMREHRHGLRECAAASVNAGVTSAEHVVDQAASRILLDAALCAAKTGLDFSSSRMRQRATGTD